MLRVLCKACTRWTVVIAIDWMRYAGELRRNDGASITTRDVHNYAVDDMICHRVAGNSLPVVGFEFHDWCGCQAKLFASARLFKGALWE